MDIRVSRPLGTLWMKAAVVGSLWASVEIILGSFLHNLKVPMSGTILAFISVYIMVAFAQVWQERGLIWRAGLICALMKSISPSALIIGPMIGIFTEAVLLELSLLLLGRNVPGYLAGGAMAVFSTIVHKTVSLLILYGFDLVKILEALYKFATKQLRIEGVHPGWLLLAVAVIYLVAGVTAAVLGIRAGRRYLSAQRASPATTELEVDLQNPYRLLAEERGQQYAMLFLPLNVAAVALGLYLINFNHYLPAALYVLLYTGFVLWRYRHTVRHLRKAHIWIQFLLLTLAATFLWKGISQGTFFSWDGLAIGLKMTGRAILIIMGFAAVGAELRSPVIRSLLYNRHLSSLYQALRLAFSVLPYILARQPQTKELLKKETLSFRFLFQQAEGLLSFLKREHERRPTVFIITGAVQQGKTTFVTKLLELLKASGVKPGGFTAPGVHNVQGQRTGFQLYDVATGKLYPLCTTSPVEGAQRVGPYYFYESGFAQGRALLAPEALTNKDLVIIDELGPMELRNEGWHSSVAQLAQSGFSPQVWVVRRPLLSKILAKWYIGTVYIADVGKDTPEAVAEALRAEIKKMPMPNQATHATQDF